MKLHKEFSTTGRILKWKRIVRDISNKWKQKG